MKQEFSLEAPPAWQKNDFKNGVWFFDGDELAIATLVNSEKTGKQYWDIERVVVDCDGENFCLRYAESREHYDAWSWFDVDYYIKIDSQGPMTEEDAEKLT